jgi:hypothetical protein
MQRKHYSSWLIVRFVHADKSEHLRHFHMTWHGLLHDTAKGLICFVVIAICLGFLLKTCLLLAEGWWLNQYLIYCSRF